MKKTSKLLALLLALLLVVATVVVLAACGPDEEEEETPTPPPAPVVLEGAAYGIVHSNKYIGKGTITVTDGKLTAATLVEVVTLSEQYTAAPQSMWEANAEQLTESHYWKTVKWGSVTAKWDDEAGAHKIGGQTWLEFFSVEANCRDYVEAAIANEITVVTAEGEKKDVLTAQQLLKSNNGYWAQSETVVRGWKGNVEATIAYVLENGFDGAEEKADFVKDGTFHDKNGVDTGATWTDIWNYFNLLKTANDRALETGVVVVTGEVTHTARTSHEYYIKVDVTVKDGTIIAVRLYTETETGKQMVTQSWNGHDTHNPKFNAWIEEEIVGQTVETVMGWDATLVEGEEFTARNHTEGIDFEYVASATATSARIIAAIQNALAKLEA